MFRAIERRDEVGRSLAIIGEDDRLDGGDGVRYRLIAETQDHREAVLLADEANRVLRC
jgi:hypothetical protein